MRGIFNYIFFYFRIIVALAFSALCIAGLILPFTDIDKEHDTPGGTLGMVGLCVLVSLICFKLWRAIWTERFNLALLDGQVIIKDKLLFRSTILLPEDIKGYSLSEYPIRFKVRSILFYLNNGKKIEFPQFLFFNFKKLIKALEPHGIKFLGEEGYYWKWVDSREYKYDK